MLAKLAAWGPSRDAAIARLRRALSEYAIGGIRTNRAFFTEIMDDEAFRAGALSTAFLDEFFTRRAAPVSNLEAEAVAALIAALDQTKHAPSRPPERSSAWLESGRESLLR